MGVKCNRERFPLLSFHITPIDIRGALRSGIALPKVEHPLLISSNDSGALFRGARSVGVSKRCLKQSLCDPLEHWRHLQSLREACESRKWPCYQFSEGVALDRNFFSAVGIYKTRRIGASKLITTGPFC